MNKIPISEIFVGYQGEGMTTGMMTIFVRVAGCNLAMDNHKCKWCDTPYALHSESYERLMTAEQIWEEIEKLRMNSLSKICLTGGEPLVYATELSSLIYYWSTMYHLVIETNGSLPIWRGNMTWSVDLKCPSSGNSDYNLFKNFSMLTSKDQLKCVIADEEDFNFALSTVSLRRPKTSIFFQPAYKLLSHATLIDWLAAERIKGNERISKIRLGTQCHKVWYPRRKKGV